MASRDPFPGMTQIGPSVYSYIPLQGRQDPSAPKLVVLCSWMAAHPTHITKYITGYQSLFPTAQILLIRSEAPDIIYRSAATLRRRIQPALDIVRSTCTKGPSRPEILLHVFSNGGSHQATNLLRTYLSTVGQRFPIHAKILDSCPGRGNLKRSYLALSAPFDRQPVYLRLPSILAVVIILCIHWLLVTSLLFENPIETIRRGLNDENVARETRRVYIYSDADRMVHWQEVEDHAADAKSKGFSLELERFEGSGHAAHVRVGGGGRYWQIVRDLWRESSKDIDEA